MAAEERISKIQNVILENRQRLSVSGVEEVNGFDDGFVQMRTVLGELTVRGEQLRVDQLSTESGELLVCGEISEIVYADVPAEKGFWSRLLG